MKDNKPIDIAEFNREMIAYVIQEVNKINDRLNFLERELRKINYDLTRGN